MAGQFTLGTTEAFSPGTRFVCQGREWFCSSSAQASTSTISWEDALYYPIPFMAILGSNDLLVNDQADSVRYAVKESQDEVMQIIHMTRA